jgi:uncharacterized membrane protein
MKPLLNRFRLTTNQLLWASVAILMTIVVASMLFNPPPPAKTDDTSQLETVSETMEGRVVQVLSEEQRSDSGPAQPVQQVLVEITKGSQQDETVEIEHGVTTVTAESRRVKDGDRVLIEYSRGPAGEYYYISDFVRLPSLLVLALVFAGAAVVVGRWVGVRSLISMGLGVLVIALFVLPLLGDGQNPVTVCITGALLLITPSLYLIYGWNWKTHSALLGVTISLIATSLLAVLFGHWSRLTGFGSDEAAFLVTSAQAQIDMRGLALGSIILGTLGVLDDVTVGQASAILELKRANPGLAWQELFRHAMRIGRDHIASMINTLMMAYVGAALPLFLLLSISDAPLTQTLNREFLAEEIVRTLVGSLGLILAVPITSLVASLLIERYVTPD